MIFNENLIRPDKDPEIYEGIIPTLGTMLLPHFSAPSPEQHNEVVYGADGLFFATYPSRRLYLRPAFRNEFDVYTTEEAFQKCPMLWVLVTSLSPGYHEITPRWRGHAFWSGMETDQAVAEVVIKMSERGGLALSEWYGFVTDKRANNTAKTKGRCSSRMN